MKNFEEKYINTFNNFSFSIKSLVVLSSILLLFFGMTACKQKTSTDEYLKNPKMCEIKIGIGENTEARSAHPTGAFPAEWVYQAVATPDSGVAIESEKLKLDSSSSSISISLEREKTYTIELKAYKSVAEPNPIFTGSKKIEIPAIGNLNEIKITLHPVSGGSDTGNIDLAFDFSAISDVAKVEIEEKPADLNLKIDDLNLSKKTRLHAKNISPRIFTVKLALKNASGELIGVMYIRDITVEPCRITNTWTGSGLLSREFVVSTNKVLKQKLFCVKTGGDDTNNNGLTPATAFATLQHAIDQCTQKGVDYLVYIIGELRGEDACAKITKGNLISIIGTGTTPTLNATGVSAKNIFNLSNGAQVSVSNIIMKNASAGDVLIGENSRFNMNDSEIIAQIEKSVTMKNNSHFTLSGSSIISDGSIYLENNTTKINIVGTLSATPTVASILPATSGLTHESLKTRLYI